MKMKEERKSKLVSVGEEKILCKSIYYLFIYFSWVATRWQWLFHM